MRREEMISLSLETRRRFRPSLAVILNRLIERFRNARRG